LRYGADLETRSLEGTTPLLWAIDNDYKQPVRLLLDRGANIKANEANRIQSSVIWATVKASGRLFSQLDQLQKIDVAGIGLWASPKDVEAVIVLLIERGAELDIKTPRGGHLFRGLRIKVMSLWSSC